MPSGRDAKFPIFCRDIVDVFFGAIEGNPTRNRPAEIGGQGDVDVNLTAMVALASE